MKNTNARLRIAALLLAASVLGLVGDAYAGEAPPRCLGLASHSSDSPAHWLKVGKIVGKDRAYFQWQIGTECLSHPINECRTPGHSYLIPGDIVIISSTAPGYVCANFSKTAREQRNYFGWIPAGQVELLGPIESTFPLEAWVGTWTNRGSSKITIRSKGNKLYAEGEAIWQGPSDPHFGEFSYEGTPSSNSMVLEAIDDPKGCKLQLILTSTLLIAADNMRCGGYNVTFTGFYRRKVH
jgi:hypothetical protein